MSDHEWYRSPDWDASEQARFAAKLARARPENRPQYLRIKALALLDTGTAVEEEAGVQLLHQVLDTGDPFEAAAAHERLGAHHLDHEDLDAAVGALRLAIAARQGGGGTGHTELTLADALLRRRTSQDVEEAGQILHSDEVAGDDYLVFTAAYYQHALLQARWCHLTRSEHTATWARRALDYASQEEPPFPRHPTVGLPKPTETELQELTAYLHHGDATP